MSSEGKSKMDISKVDQSGMYTAREDDQVDIGQLDFKELKLVFNLFADETKLNNFIPFVYMEKNNIENNRLLVYDIQDMKLKDQRILTELSSQLHVDNKGFNCYMLAQTSELFTKCSKMKKMSVSNEHGSHSHVEIPR